MRIKLTPKAYYQQLIATLRNHPGYAPGMEIIPCGNGWKCRSTMELFSPDDQVVFSEVIEQVSTKYYRRETLRCKQTEFTTIIDVLNKAYEASRAQSHLRRIPVAAF